MNDQTISTKELNYRSKLVFYHFTKPEYLTQSKPPQAFLLLSAGAEIRTYYIMEGYTDNCIYLDIREIFRKFRQGGKIPCSDQIKELLIQTGFELALFCLRSRYDIAVELTGMNMEYMNITINSLTCLGYQVRNVMFDVDENPYTDLDPNDESGVLTPNLYDQLHTHWIKKAAVTVMVEEAYRQAVK